MPGKDDSRPNLLDGLAGEKDPATSPAESAPAATPAERLVPPGFDAAETYDLYRKLYDEHGHPLITAIEQDPNRPDLYTSEYLTALATTLEPEAPPPPPPPAAEEETLGSFVFHDQEATDLYDQLVARTSEKAVHDAVIAFEGKPPILNAPFVREIEKILSGAQEEQGGPGEGETEPPAAVDEPVVVTEPININEEVRFRDQVIGTALTGLEPGTVIATAHPDGRFTLNTSLVAPAAAHEPPAAPAEEDVEQLTEAEETFLVEQEEEELDDTVLTAQDIRRAQRLDRSITRIDAEIASLQAEVKDLKKDRESKIDALRSCLREKEIGPLFAGLEQRARTEAPADEEADAPVTEETPAEPEPAAEEPQAEPEAVPAEDANGEPDARATAITDYLTAAEEMVLKNRLDGADLNDLGAILPHVLGSLHFTRATLVEEARAAIDGGANLLDFMRELGTTRDPKGRITAPMVRNALKRLSTE